MKKEINLLERYPKTNRDTSKRLGKKTYKNQLIARKFGEEFFDGSRDTGYGGFYYNEKYWKEVVEDFISYYHLDENSKILDVGCAKGFMLHDFKKAIPSITVKGIDISNYAIENSKEEVKEFLQVANALHLPYDDDSFDLVISITTLHNLGKDDLKIALKEIERVSKKDIFITLDAYSNDDEKKAMEAWNLTALTMMSTKNWKLFFEEAGYNGDYYWFKP